VGTVIRSRGRQWRIARFENEAAILEAAEESGTDGAPGGAVTSPDPLGDTPLTVEILSEI
jgi:hypothetical protein